MLNPWSQKEACVGDYITRGWTRTSPDGARAGAGEPTPGDHAAERSSPVWGNDGPGLPGTFSQRETTGVYLPRRPGWAPGEAL